MTRIWDLFIGGGGGALIFACFAGITDFMSESAPALKISLCWAGGGGGGGEGCRSLFSCTRAEIKPSIGVPRRAWDPTNYTGQNISTSTHKKTPNKTKNKTKATQNEKRQTSKKENVSTRILSEYCPKLPKLVPEYHLNLARISYIGKMSGGGTVPPPPPPVSYAYESKSNRENRAFLIQWLLRSSRLYVVNVWPRLNSWHCMYVIFTLT